MIYVAKFLKVEGDGDITSLYKFKINGTWTEPSYFDDFLGVGIEEVRLVKPFLCSRDIQVGDRYYNERADAWDICDSKTMLEQIIEAEERDGKVRFSVLAEISPNAVWVEDGDEFNINQLSQQGTGVNITKGGGFIKIKCSQCKTFH